MGVQGGGGDRYVHYAKRAIVEKCLNTFVPHCSKLTGCSSLICLSYI